MQQSSYSETENIYDDKIVVVLIISLLHSVSTILVHLL